MEMIFKTEKFEGPLDLLLSLIAKNKMDIFDIQISLILDQYLEYMNSIPETDTDYAGEFITMAAELMFIKSKMLLPRTEDEEDPRETLVQALMEYGIAKKAAEMLGLREEEFGGRFVKDEDEVDAGPLLPQEAQSLSRALARLLTVREDRIRAEKTTTVQTIDPIIKKKVFSVAAKSLYIIRFMLPRKRAIFEDIFTDMYDRDEIIAVFCALLELVKGGRMSVEQTEGDSYILTLNTGKVKNERDD
ncbi:MAG: segregation/condensation protein A [Clostridia bacterium]|nr:segregation/condensation protein A [Clostridia bacterium]